MNVNILEWDLRTDTVKPLNVEIQPDMRYQEVKAAVVGLFDVGIEEGQSAVRFAAGVSIVSLWHGGIHPHGRTMGVRVRWGKDGAMVANVIGAMIESQIRASDHQFTIRKAGGGFVEVS
jgi:hypothetical protein